MRNIFRLPRDQRGQAMVEFALVFPVQLFITVAIIQYALIVMGRTVVEHAGFAAARCVLLQEQGLYSDADAEKAAQIVCAPITGLSMGSTSPGTPFQLPGWGTMPKSGASIRKTRLIVVSNGSQGTGEVQVRVEHDFELTIPLANHLFAFPWKSFLYIASENPSPTQGVRNSLYAKYGTPHIRLIQEVTIPKTWKE